MELGIFLLNSKLCLKFSNWKSKIYTIFLEVIISWKAFNMVFRIKIVKMGSILKSGLKVSDSINFFYQKLFHSGEIIPNRDHFHFAELDYISLSTVFAILLFRRSGRNPSGWLFRASGDVFLTIFAILFPQNRNKFKVSHAKGKVCLAERKSFPALSKPWPRLSCTSSFSSRSLRLYIFARERIGWGNKVSWGWSNSPVEVNIRLSNIPSAVSSCEDWQTWTPSNFVEEFDKNDFCKPIIRDL